MNKKGDFQFSPIIKAIIVMLVVVVIIFIWNSTAFAGIKAFLGFKIPGQDQKIEPLTNYDFYNTFVGEYKACKESSDSNCKCLMTSLEDRIPLGYAIYLAQRGDDVRIYLMKYSEIKSRVFKDLKDDESAEKILINGDKLFTLKTLANRVRITNKNIIFDDFGNAIGILIYRTNMWPSGEGRTFFQDYADLKNFAEILDPDDFTSNIYKFSKTNTAFLGESQVYTAQWDSLDECKISQT